MKTLIIFDLDVVVYPHLNPTIWMLFFLLIYYCLVPLQLFIQIERKLYFFSWSGYFLDMCEYLSLIVHSLHLCGKINRKKNIQTSNHLKFDFIYSPGGKFILCSWSVCFLQMCGDLSPVLHKIHFCGKIKNKPFFSTSFPKWLINLKEWSFCEQYCRYM